MEVKFWGVRGSTPCANKQYMQFGGNTTCVQIKDERMDKWLILDSGTGIRNLGNKLVNQNKVMQGHLFVTHPHWDHLQGFPFFKPIYSGDVTLHVHLPEQPHGTCREILAGQMTETYFPVTPDMLHADVKYITQPANRRDYKDFSVEYILANHHTNAAIYKFTFEEKTIIFAPDNEVIVDDTPSEFNKMFTDFVLGADLLIHDGQYNLQSYKYKKNWGHSAWEKVAELAREAEISHLILTHHDPDSDDQYLSKRDEFVKDRFGSDFESIQLAFERLTVQL